MTREASGAVVVDRRLSARASGARSRHLPAARVALRISRRPRGTIAPVPIPRDFSDWMLGSFWAHPERVLDPDARAATSGFAPTWTRGCRRARRGARWVVTSQTGGCGIGRHGALRAIDEYDVGFEIGGRAGIHPGARRPIAASPFVTRCGLFFVLARIGRRVYGERSKRIPLRTGSAAKSTRLEVRSTPERGSCT